MDEDEKLVLQSEVGRLLKVDHLEAHPEWMACFKDGKGVPYARFRTFAGLSRFTEDQLKEAIEDDIAMVAPHIVAENGLVRPKTVPTPSHDRMVFATPLPFKASENEIKKFFSRFGTVENISRPEWVDATTGNAMKKPSAIITFANAETANKCIANPPDYKKLGNLGDFFIPALSVAPYTGKKQNFGKGSETRHRFVQMEATDRKATTENLTPAAREVLNKEHILVIDGIPAGTDWKDIRAFQQSALRSFTKGKRAVVYTLLSPTRGSAFVFCKSPDAGSIVLQMPQAELKDKTITLRQCTTSDIDYLRSLPVEGPAKKTAPPPETHTTKRRQM
eukprot:TRINITY_DN14826_c0_g1_i2.p1 TRINITY_DN14826_c0_g1~~TRINITY_DN14826_c0_g1_i2.p1  ORF type:complete len:361 (+),score=68.52 TRINITY_DN14826_c0_g1_i2:83-1084(+)